MFIADCSGNVNALDIETGRTAWKYPVDPDGGTQFHGNPVLVDSLIVFDTDQGFKQKVGSFYALDRFTGELRWSLRLDVGCATDLAVVGPSLFGVTIDDRLVSIDALHGTINWETGAGWAIDPDAGYYEDIRTPTLASGCVASGTLVGYAGRDHAVHAVFAETGEKAWSTAVEGYITTRLCAADTEWVFGTSNYELHCLGLDSGRITRTVRTPLIPQETMAWRDGRLYFLGGFEDARPADLLCLDARTGEILWHSVMPDTSKHAFWYVPRLHFWRGTVIVGSTHGLLVAYDEMTGAIRWQKRLEGAIRGIGSTPDMLFVGNFDGKLFGLRRQDAVD